MGFFKKVFKGVKKTFKKIARGIKKVVKKVGKAFGKLGVVGQIGLMFLMPYAMQGLGTFWKGFGGFANKLATSQGVGSQIFGKALSAVHTAGNMVGRVYTGVTDTINSAVDLVSGKGSAAEFTDSVKSIFSGPVDEAKSLLTGDKFTAFKKEQALLDKEKIVKNVVEGVDDVEKIPSVKDVISADSKEVKNFASDTASKLAELGKDAVEEKAKDKGIVDTIMDYGSQQVENVKDAIQNFDLGEEIVGGVTGGIKAGTKQKVASEIMDAKDPVYNSTSINIPSYMGAAYGNDFVSQQVDFTMQQQTGNSWMNNSLANYDHIQAGLLQDETSWFHNAIHARQLVYGTGN